jgi:hypothetical protein
MQMQKPPPSGPKRIRWSESVTLHHYTECGHSRAEKIAIREGETHSKRTRRHTFQCEADAIISQQRKKQDQHISHFEKIFPELVKLQWSHLSLLEMKAVESEIISELDSLSQIDATSEHLQQSREYNLTEKQLSLLLEAYECLFQLSHLRSAEQHGNCKIATSIKSRIRRFKLPWLMLFNYCVSFDVETDADFC